MDQEKKFSIGGFEFETFYEYRAAQEDVQKIECINNELDVQDPEVAIRLYQDIRDGIITFNSPIGEKFAEHIGDIVAHRSVDLLDDRAVIQEADKQVKNQRVIGLICLLLALVIFGFYGYTEIKDIMETRQLAEMAKQVADNKSENNQNSSLNSPTEVQNQTPDADKQLEGLIKSPWDTNIDASTLSILPEFTELYEQNNDFIGWIEIPGTDINYPVMQTPLEPEFYLQRDFNKNDDSNGTLFVDYRCDVVNSTTNTIIYGHNMKSGKMFGGLKKFLDEKYCEGHNTIIFKTLYEEREFEIVAVGLSQVGYSDDDSYKYYDFIDAVTQDEFDEFNQNIQELAVYKKDNGVSYSDKLLTLSTCNSYTEDGRLFVVAKRIK